MTKKSEEYWFGILWNPCITENNKAWKISWTELSRAGGYFESLFLPLTQLFQHPTLLLPSTFLNFLRLPSCCFAWVYFRCESGLSFSPGIHFPFSISSVCLFSKAVSPWAHRTSESPHDGEALPLRKGKSQLEEKIRGQNEHCRG